MEDNQKIIIMLGVPGAGKGTQAELLSEKLGFFHLETSGIINKNLANVKQGDFVEAGDRKYSLMEEKEKKDSGKLMSPALIDFWMKKELEKLISEGQSIILNGSPRTLEEGKVLIPFLKDLCGAENIEAVLIDLSEKDSLFRNSHRKQCELANHTLIYNEETDKLTLCPFDGSKLYQREDDDPEVIKVRLREYKNKTFPLLEYFKEQGLSVKTIEGAPAPSIVFENILKAVQ